MYLGIDFSGGASPWRKRRSKPTVWVAEIDGATRPRLTDLRSVQCMSGEEAPFDRLVTRLKQGDFAAAAIDAPFAIPAKYIPPGGHPELLDRVSRLPPAVDRPFPLGATLVALADGITPLDQKKPYRETERSWIDQGINTRSTLWNGPRGGAAFTMACLTLLAQAGRPIWPWNCGPGMLVEAFPAAQLFTWKLPHSEYGKTDQVDKREAILAGLRMRLDYNPCQRDKMLTSPDALDAVIAAFAAIAAERNGAPAEYPGDGLIAVMDNHA